MLLHVNVFLNINSYLSRGHHLISIVKCSNDNLSCAFLSFCKDSLFHFYTLTFFVFLLRDADSRRSKEK